MSDLTYGHERSKDIGYELSVTTTHEVLLFAGIPCSVGVIRGNRFHAAGKLSVKQLRAIADFMEKLTAEGEGNPA